MKQPILEKVKYPDPENSHCGTCLEKLDWHYDMAFTPAAQRHRLRDCVNALATKPVREKLQRGVDEAIAQMVAAQEAAAKKKAKR